jgi:hypothetical protein
VKCRYLALCALGLAALSCSPIGPAADPSDEDLATNAMSGAESLGEDVLLISIASDDDTLIGKVFIPRAAEQGTEVDFQANPCQEHLTVKTFPAHRKVSDTRRFDAGINASAMLKAINIGAHAANVTDYQYAFDITRKLVADETVAYGECCSKARGGCGEKFVRELYYGNGKYRLLKSKEAGGGVDVPGVAGVGAHAKYETLGEQSFQGFFAYKTKVTPTPQPQPSEDRTVVVPTDGGPDMVAPSVLEGAAAIQQDGASLLITTKSADNLRDNQIKAIGNARKKQRRALKNLLAGPPYNTPPETLNDRVEQVYKGGKEEDAYRDDNGDWFLKMRYKLSGLSRTPTRARR